MTNPPNSGSDNWQRVHVRDTVPGVNVAQALISNVSQARAADIYARNAIERTLATDQSPEIRAARAAQPGLAAMFRGPVNSNRILGDGLPREVVAIRNEQLANPPQEYVIYYYVWQSRGQPYPTQIAQTHANDLQGTAMQPVNGNMQQAIGQSLATIAAQLPGRFRFVPTNNPADADLSFAAIPHNGPNRNFTGTSDFNDGTILLNAEDFRFNTASGRSLNVKDVIHEIGHGLGLRHPFTREDNDGRTAATDEASYLDTIMTYSGNNQNRGGDGAGWRVPVGFMGSDLQALAMLYPIQQDRRAGAVRVGTVPQMSMESANGTVAIQGSGIRPGQVGFIPQGMHVQFIPNTSYDVVQLSTAVPHRVESYRKFDKVHRA